MNLIFDLKASLGYALSEINNVLWLGNFIMGSTSILVHQYQKLADLERQVPAVTLVRLYRLVQCVKMT